MLGSVLHQVHIHNLISAWIEGHQGRHRIAQHSPDTWGFNYNTQNTILPTNMAAMVYSTQKSQRLSCSRSLAY